MSTPAYLRKPEFTPNNIFVIYVINGWIKFLPFYCKECKRPSCSLISEVITRCVERKWLASLETLFHRIQYWWNLVFEYLECLSQTCSVFDQKVMKPCDRELEKIGTVRAAPGTVYWIANAYAIGRPKCLVTYGDYGDFRF